MKKKNAKERNVLRSFKFFCKRTKRSCFLLRSLQLNETFSAFFYILCKRRKLSLRSFTFLRKERKRTHRSFGSHKSPKTKKQGKRTLHSLKECKRTMRSEQKRTRCPTLGGGEESLSISHMLRQPSARQCYFEMKMIYAPLFSILSFIIL